jgi:2-succinyl-6-hydroxy-2,4-cyclohexadiene-1-carboxylate synthase
LLLSYNFREVEGTVPLVFLHGFLESSTMWIPLELQNWSCSTVTVDLPGHGNSMDYLPEGEPSIDKIADAVVKLLDFLEIEQFNVIGHSMGGYIGLSIKKRCNGCRKLILMNSTYLADNDDKIEDRLRMASLVFEAKSLIISQSIPRLFYKYSAEDQLVCDLIKEAQLIKPEAIAYASIAMSKRAQNIDLVIEHKKDVLIISGKHDNIINVAQLQIDSMKFGLQLIAFSNSGHMSHFEDTEILKTTLNNFFST